MLVFFVIAYLLCSVCIGLYVSRRVHSSTDYVLAGRSLPIYVTIATVFATWFGSETVLGTSSTFLEEGLWGILSDPFGASLCLILVALVFARPIYRMKLLTIGDFYRVKYGRTVELMVAVAICFSYLGWVTAQIMALGLVFNILSAGDISLAWGMVIGISIVLVYTLFGGMWSVAITDFLQMMLIVIGLIIIAFFMGDMVGGPMVVIQHAVDNGKLTNFPEFSLATVLTFLGAILTMGFGSIPQQDVFQRVMSAKNENNGVYGTFIGAVLYFIFAFVPIFLAYAGNLIDPDMVAKLMEEDSQYVLPQLILSYMPLFVQILFFGALLSAIMSTASGTLLAPSVVLMENIIKPTLPHLKDKQFLLLTRVCVAFFAVVVLVLALNSSLSIFEMVENAYKVTLAGAIVPLFAGIYWKRANSLGGTLSFVLGVSVWLVCEFVAPEGEGLVPPQLAGFFASCIGMLIGGFVGKKSASR